jgi:hypothetical protein
MEINMEGPLILFLIGVITVLFLETGTLLILGLRFWKQRTTKTVTEEVTEVVSGHDSDKALEELLGTFQKYKLNQLELVLVCSNLLYSVGASIEGYKGVAPSPTETLKLYYANPQKVGIAMMAQALHMNQEWTASLERAMKEVDKKP